MTGFSGSFWPCPSRPIRPTLTRRSLAGTGFGRREPATRAGSVTGRENWMPERSKLGGLRGVALIVIGIFMGATLITPAVAHVGGTLTHLWNAPNHIRDKVRAYGDNRWLGKTAKATDSDLLDGLDSSAFAIKTIHNNYWTDSC